MKEEEKVSKIQLESNVRRFVFGPIVLGWTLIPLSLSPSRPLFISIVLSFLE